jgi:type I restriction enzyme S subunit
LANGKISIGEKTKRVNAAEFNRYNHPLDGNSILLSINGTIGNLAIFRDEKVVLGKSACFINIDPRLVNKLFIYYVLQTDSIKDFFNLELTGSTIKNLSLGTIKSAQLLVPTLAEQQRIADCLTSLDDLIAAQTQKHEALKTHKKGLMQQLFPSPEEVEA